MASARRITLALSTAMAKQRRGVLPQWSRRDMASSIHSSRRIDLSTAMVKPWSSNKSPSMHCNKNRDLSSDLCSKIGFLENHYTRHHLSEIGYTVDVADLLFSPERDFLVRNNAQKIKVDDLWGKTIVLIIVPLDAGVWRDRDAKWDTWDMIDAYYELLRMGSAVEFVCVPVRIRHPSDDHCEEALFHDLFSAVPFPAVPLSDAQAPEGPVVQTFSLDDPNLCYGDLPYWVVIDPTNTIVATRWLYSGLFKRFGGAELHPLSRERIEDLQGSQSRMQLISQWDQLLASDTRDFLLSSNGDKVPISSLKGKLVGLYFCENIPHPPRMKAIKKVYEEAKSRGYDFEIVQITFHYHPFNAQHRDTDLTVQQRCEGVSWLTLPFMDPSCRKIQRILHCVEEDEEDSPWVGDFGVREHWLGDSLVLIHPDDYSSGVRFELSGAEILERWGIEGYPFTRPSLCKAEYEVQKTEVTLEMLLQPNQCLLRSVGDTFDLVDAVSQLSGKRVFVLFAPHTGVSLDVVAKFVTMLKSEYLTQPDDESKFEVMYVSTAGDVSSFKEFIKDMPWLVLPISTALNLEFLFEVFKVNLTVVCGAAFDEQGELIAKAHRLPEKKEGDKLRFPFIDQDLEMCINREVNAMCDVSNYLCISASKSVFYRKYSVGL